jgi:hypothetical protein
MFNKAAFTDNHCKKRVSAFELPNILEKYSVAKVRGRHLVKPADNNLLSKENIG